jgi:predicted peptidase
MAKRAGGLSHWLMKLISQILFTLLLATAPAIAQDNLDGFFGRTHKSSAGTMQYRLFIPKGYDPAKKYPLVLWLHGSGGAGNDNRKQITLASTQGTHAWTRPENQAKNPAFVLAPQSSSGKAWTSTGQLDVVLEILAAVQKEFSIDPLRLYVAGQSMGGYGTWELIIRKPGLFAAAIPLCGGGRFMDASVLAKMPIWAFHGAADPTVSVWESRKMIEAIRKAGGNPRYTEYPGVRHEVWIPAFKESGLLDWVFAQHR